MTSTQRVLARRWRPVLLACVLVALAGAVVVIWARIDRESDRANGLAAEADRRGSAVTTLADDVRTLRAQLEAKGEKPRAPDPGRAVKDLPQRSKVPAPVPGPRGEPGQPGEPGEAGEPGTDGDDGAPGADGQPGEDGRAGTPGEDGARGEQGPRGEAGKDGRDGADGARGPQGEQGPRGERGPAGPNCPDGYSLQPSTLERDALVCKRDPEPEPQPQGERGQQAAVTDRKRW